MNAEPNWYLPCEPREVQLEALRRSRGKKGWGHFLEQRLGKTRVALNEFEMGRREFGMKWLIVLTPSNFKLDWPLEADDMQMNLPKMAAVVTGNKKKHLKKFLWDNRETGGMVAVHYEAIRIQEVREMLLKVCGPKTMIVADESITIKGFNSQTFKAALEMAELCGMRRALTGKPSSQGAHDYWAQLRFIGALQGVNYYAFRNKFCKMGGFRGKKIIGAKNEDDLRTILDNWCWIARRKDWLVVEGQYNHVRPDYYSRRIKLAPRQEELLLQMQNDFIAEVEDGLVVTADQAVTKLMKMDQIASGFIYDEDKVAHVLVEPSKNPKIVEIKKVLDQEIDGKLIVFVKFKPSINLLMEELVQYKPAFLKGQMSDEEKIEQKRLFNEGDARVMIAQMDTARYGHTLIGSDEQRCYYSIFFENDFSLNTRSQAEERNQGVNQMEIATVCDFVATTFDIKKIEALQNKEDVAAATMGYDRATGILPLVT